MKNEYVLILIILLNYVNSWRNEGHLIMSELLKMGLTNEEYSFYYSITKGVQSQQHGRIKSFIEASVWPDLLKRFSFDYFTKYHSFLFKTEQNPLLINKTSLNSTNNSDLSELFKKPDTAYTFMVRQFN